jgi:hypothetical protein
MSVGDSDSNWGRCCSFDRATGDSVTVVKERVKKFVRSIYAIVFAH